VGTKNDPTQIGRYQIIERVGRGGMGVLFRGMDPVLDREVAIKLMLVDFSEDEDALRPRFYREARASAKLQHRNIVTVFEFAEEGSTPYIVMEFLRGTSLAARMASPLPLAVEDKLDVIAQLCDALHYAHEQGVVHRDVKPANVFLLTDGTVKLLDFGIAKLTTSTLTRRGDVLGSASYMSPEQVAGSDSVDGRSDIFSIGVVLYELLAGRKPFHAEAPTAIIMKILHEEPPPLESLVPGLPAQLVAAVNKALAKDPAARFQTAGELSKQLQWIRKALVSANEGGAALEETRFATPTEIKKFQEALEAARPTD
jgi:serine/threonine-protein kinase